MCIFDCYVNTIPIYGHKAYLFFFEYRNICNRTVPALVALGHRLFVKDRACIKRRCQLEFCNRNDLGLASDLSVRSNGDLDDHDSYFPIVCGTPDNRSIQVH